MNTLTLGVSDFVSFYSKLSWILFTWLEMPKIHNVMMDSFSSFCWARCAGLSWARPHTVAAEAVVTRGTGAGQGLSAVRWAETSLQGWHITLTSQVPSQKCSTVYEERCSQPTKEVCEQVTRVSQQNRWGDLLYSDQEMTWKMLLFSGAEQPTGVSAPEATARMTKAREARGAPWASSRPCCWPTPWAPGTRRTRWEWGLEEIWVLNTDRSLMLTHDNFLFTEYFHQTQETCHNVPTHHCQSSPVENVVHECKKVSCSTGSWCGLILHSYNSLSSGFWWAETVWEGSCEQVQHGDQPAVQPGVRLSIQTL